VEPACFRWRWWPVKNKHSFVCINCPLSCSLELTEENGEVLEVTGNDCKVGARYAEEEFRDPRRVVTTTVPVREGILPLLPVRTEKTIPKRLVADAVRMLAGVVVEAPVHGGQVVYRDIMDTGVDVIASRDLARNGGKSGS
jgi:CxxC motif-containing protein